MEVIDWYKENVLSDAIDWLDVHCPESKEDRWDYLWDDLCMEVTGNDGGAPVSYNKEMVHHIVWESDFISYCRDLDSNLGELILRGEYVVDCYARYMILEYYLYEELQRYWKELCQNEEDSE